MTRGWCVLPLCVTATLGVARLARADHGDEPGSAAREVLPTEPVPPAPAAPGPAKAPATAPLAPPAAASSDAKGAEQEVTVVGTRVARTAGSAHVLGEKKLARQGYDDAHAVLAEVPGVYSRGEDGVGLRPNIGIRGVNPDRSKKVALLEDGVPFAPAPYSAPAAYYFPLVMRMTAIRVVKGPASVVHGPQTVAGAIDLVTRAVPATPSGSLDGAAGAYGYNKLHAYAGTGDEKMGLLLEGAHLGSSGFKELPSGADTGFARNEVMAKGYYVVDPAARSPQEIKVKFTYSDEISNESYLGLADADFRNNPNARYSVSELDRMRSFRTALAVSHVASMIPRKLVLTTTAYRNDIARTWRKVNGFRGADLFSVLRAPDAGQNAVYAGLLRGQGEGSSPGEALLVGPNSRDYVSQGVQTVLRWEGKSGPLAHRLEYGLRLHQDRIERRHSEDAYRVVRGELVPEGSATVVTAFNEASTEVLALHAADAVTWGPLTLTPGVRFEVMRPTLIDKITQVTTKRLTSVFLPGAGAFVSLTRDFGLLAGAYRGFSPAAPGGDPKPELSVNYEGGARFVRGPARAEGIGFLNDYSNLTDICTLASGCRAANLDAQFNAGAARVYGLETFVEHELPVGALKFPLTGSYTVTRSEFKETFTSEDPIYGRVQAGDEVPYVPRHQLALRAGVEHARAGGNVAFTYGGKMREEPGTGPVEERLHTDASFMVDVGARFHITERLSVYGNVRNLLDEQVITSRRPFGARPNAPRWVLAGAKLTF